MLRVEVHLKAKTKEVAVVKAEDQDFRPKAKTKDVQILRAEDPEVHLKAKVKITGAEAKVEVKEVLKETHV